MSARRPWGTQDYRRTDESRLDEESRPRPAFCNRGRRLEHISMPQEERHMTIHMTVRKSLLAVGSIGLISLAAVSNVSARGQGAAIGRAINGGDLTCFGNFFNGTQNNCASSRGYEVPLVADAGGAKSISYTGNNVTCQGLATDTGITSFVGGTVQTLGGGA